MKKLRTTIYGIVAMLLLFVNAVQAQNQLFWIHVDHVKPSMEKEYQKIAKDFADACRANNVADMTFNVWRHDNGDYYYSSPLKNFAEMDKDGLKPLRDKMGEEKFNAMFSCFDKCYDSHQSFMATYREDLSYLPGGKLPEGDFNRYHYMYVSPGNSQAVEAKLKEIKEMWTKKGAKVPYFIMHSGFGAAKEFYLAITRNKDALGQATASAENNKLLGEDWGKKWDELYALLSYYKSETSMYQADMSYAPKK